jgi:hypothetical protein
MVHLQDAEFAVWIATSQPSTDWQPPYYQFAPAGYAIENMRYPEPWRASRPLSASTKKKKRSKIKTKKNQPVTPLPMMGRYKAYRKVSKTFAFGPPLGLHCIYSNPFSSRRR